MTGELFLSWIKHFKKHVNSSQENKVLLLLDGHSSHKQLEVLNYAKEHGIVMLAFPPHCTHRLQPLDVAFFGPLKTYYNQAITKWLMNNPGRVVTQFQIANLFSEAYGKAATVSNALSGFLSTGISPFNRDIFPEHLFSPAAPTDRPENINHSMSTTTTQPPVQTTAAPHYVKPQEISPMPSASRSGEKKEEV